MGAGWNSTNNYRLSEITYDKNGNIKTLQRNDLNGISSNFGFADDKYKYTGKERDVETNYDYFGARYYDSRLGRWLQVDPLAEKYPGWSPYNYALNNPLIIIDPNGKDTTSVNSQIEYDSNSGKETVTETIIDEKGDDDNPNGPTTRTTTNVAVINPDGTIKCYFYNSAK